MSRAREAAKAQELALFHAGFEIEAPDDEHDTGDVTMPKWSRGEMRERGVGEGDDATTSTRYNGAAGTNFQYILQNVAGVARGRPIHPSFGLLLSRSMNAWLQAKLLIGSHDGTWRQESFHFFVCVN